MMAPPVVGSVELDSTSSQESANWSAAARWRAVAALDIAEVRTYESGRTVIRRMVRAMITSISVMPSSPRRERADQGF